MTTELNSTDHFDVQHQRPDVKRIVMGCAIAATVAMAGLIYCGLCAWGNIGPGPARINDRVRAEMFDLGISFTKIVDRYSIEGCYGERFAVVVEFDAGFPDTDYSWVIYEVSPAGRKCIYWCMERAPHGDFSGRGVKRLHLGGIYSDPGIRCYQWAGDGLLLFKTRPGGDWFYLYNHEFRHLQSKYDPLLIPFAQSKFRTGKLRWVKIFGEYLVRHGDSSAKETLMRQARGQFTRAEIRANAAEGVSSSVFQQSAQKILEACSVTLKPDEILREWSEGPNMSPLR